MKLRGLLVLLVTGCLVAADPPPGGLGKGEAGKRPSPNGQTLEQEVVLLRARVKSLEQRLTEMENLLKKTPSVHAKPLGRVGQIFVAGNSKTPDPVILGQLPFVPGSTFSEADLELGVRRLELLNIFVVDPARGIRPVVKVLDRDANTPFKDVLVEIQEK